MSDLDKEVTEAVAAAFGRSPGRGHGTLEAFVSAGFDEDQARRGVQMLESGAYLDFVDVAESLRRESFSLLGAANRPVAPRVTEASIVAAARGLGEASPPAPVSQSVPVTESAVEAAVRGAFGLRGL